MADPVNIDGGGGRALETILIIAALALGAWFVFTRMKKPSADPAPIKDRPEAPPAKAPPLNDQGKVWRDSQVTALLNLARPQCPEGSYWLPAKSGGTGRCESTKSVEAISEALFPRQASLTTLAQPDRPVSAALNLMPAAQQLVSERPAAVTAPTGAVISTQPVPPQSSPKPATSQLSAAGRPSAGLIAAPKAAPVPVPPPPAPKPSPPPPPAPTGVTKTAVSSNRFSSSLAVRLAGGG